ncbi:hypothetical protein [Nonomuraea rubra]
MRDPVRGSSSPAADQIITQLAKMPCGSLGAIKLPVVVRIP